jgi:hypothetical protein
VPRTEDAELVEVLASESSEGQISIDDNDDVVSDVSDDGEGLGAARKVGCQGPM